VRIVVPDLLIRLRACFADIQYCVDLRQLVSSPGRPDLEDVRAAFKTRPVSAIAVPEKACIWLAKLPSSAPPVAFLNAESRQ
jgi:hypothetical protein